MNKSIITALSLLVLTGCVSQKAPAPKIVKTQNTCSPLNALLNAHANGFSAVKANKVENDFINQWHANSHFIGKTCTITQYNKQQFSYQCTSENKQDRATSLHTQTADKIRQCLASQGWYENTKESATSMSSNFVLDEAHPAITLFTSLGITRYITRFEIAPPLGN
ncbi:MULTISPECIES: lipoprotein [unclassified Pseudoalteromonas]|jgi:hypothetical protein|uniref:lipoprotein n=1 Tax=unclassified Pseudoalteromonas TaxID=194690 RepID=UPI00257380E4|nr:hypothetical protein [Pseudoalteromonas sp. MM1]BED91253.1 hypothetical protein PspMM1_37210 [Pseudoalteromonas sp. MM1]